MPCLILQLKYVTDEEADEVRQLFYDNNIAIYETAAGLFGTSVAGIWLSDKSQESLARSLLKDYGELRSERIRRDYQTQRSLGQLETFWQRSKAQPFKICFAVIAIMFILIFSLMPFVELF